MSSLCNDDAIDVDIESLSKLELISRVRKLEANVRQLRGIIKKRHLITNHPSSNLNKLNNCDNQDKDKSPVTKFRKCRQFDFNRYHKRHIVLKFLYLGWDYQGFVVQEDTNQTIEDHLFAALIKTRLIEDRTNSNYHRCGRTDKGVSAFSQVISIDVRSKLNKGFGLIKNPNVQCPEMSQENQSTINDEEEIDYCGILNKVLPNEIRCISWAPVRSEFSSRFDCKGRCYYYYFPASSLNIGRMIDAAQYLKGTHDFTNFCKKDTSRKEINNIRTIQSVRIFPASDQSDDQSGYSIYIVEIAASGFLWHQIRFIMSVLFLIAEGREEVTLVQKLLDVKSITSKPQYMLTSDFPLILFKTFWNPDDIGNWNFSEITIKELIKHLQSLWTRESVKCSMIRSMIDQLTHDHLKPNNQPINFQHNVLINELSSKSYKNILDRPRCGNVEENVELPDN